MIRFLIIVLLLISFFITTVPVVFIMLLIGLFNKHARDVIAFKIVKFAFRIALFICGTKIDVKGLENIPRNTPVLYVGNHSSYMDILLGYRYVPGLTGFIAKKEIKKVPGLNWWMYLMNCLFLDREDPRAGLQTILEACEKIGNGISIFVFPEGTRSKTGELGDFKEGTFKIASKTKCPIVPVALTNTVSVFEKQFPKIRPAKVTINFGEPIFTDSLSKSELKTLGAVSKAKIQGMLDSEEI